MDCYEVNVADMAAIMDRLALTHGFLDGHTPYHAAIEVMDGIEGGEKFGPLLLQAMRKLLELRVADPKGFDVVVLKTLAPDMTHDDLAQAMTVLGNAGWSHRARSREAVKRLVERFPQLDCLLTFDKRGGNRHQKVTSCTLLAEYDKMAAAEEVKPRADRRPKLREGSICHELACRYNIRGRDGKPSWMAVEKRIRDARRVPTKSANVEEG